MQKAHRTSLKNTRSERSELERANVSEEYSREHPELEVNVRNELC